MRINKNIALSSRSVLLVPYEAHHVPTYHAWLESEELREATASERLTLEEEYAMQKSWREDPDKLTFIVCHPLNPDSEILETSSADAPDKLIGDVNLFLYDDEDRKGGTVGEIELMVARTECQGKGLGRATLLLFLWYLVRRRCDIVGSRGGDNLDGLRVKINQLNVRSIRLFGSLGFQKMSDTPNYFGEFELHCEIRKIENLVRIYEVQEGMREMEYGKYQ